MERVSCQVMSHYKPLSHFKIFAILCVFGTVLNVLIAIWRITATTKHLHRQEVPTYKVNWWDPSYVGSGYPMQLPTEPIDVVAMSLHETMHYGLNASEEIGDLEWATAVHYAQGYGRARVGPERRVYAVSFFHQLHCLRNFQSAIVNPAKTEGVRPTPGHIQHCLNYVRQTLLCAAVDMLEKGDFMASSFTEGKVGSDLVCHDWQAVVAGVMQRNYDEWMEWSTRWN